MVWYTSPPQIQNIIRTIKWGSKFLLLYNWVIFSLRNRMKIWSHNFLQKKIYCIDIPTSVATCYMCICITYLSSLTSHLYNVIIWRIFRRITRLENNLSILLWCHKVVYACEKAKWQQMSDYKKKRVTTGFSMNCLSMNYFQWMNESNVSGRYMKLIILLL